MPKTSRIVGLLVALTLLVTAAPTRAAPEGQITWGVHTTLVPGWFDPAETMIVTPFMVLYALHDALVKRMPGTSMAAGLAESWSMSPDGLVYEFVLRRGVRFHNGDAVTAEDVKFSFERYRGIFARELKEKVTAVETPDPLHIRFRLNQAWPDFLMFYTSTTGAGWVVPKKYIEKVGDDGFRKAPIGAGPYRFVSFTPGTELVLEAFEPYWRKTPSVKRLVLRVIPDDTTRAIALKRGEVDIAYLIVGDLADDVRRTPGLTVKPVYPSTHFVYFADQWDPKSPWHDQRVRVATNLAIDRQAINEARTLGFSRITSSIIPSTFDFAWRAPAYPYDPAKAKRLLAEAGYPGGFDGGDYFSDTAAASDIGEAVVNALQVAGIRVRLRPLERAAFFKGFAEKRLKNLVHVFSGEFGNAATRLGAFAVSGGTYVYGGYPDLDQLYRAQATELDRAKRAAILHHMQQLVYERAMFAPIYERAFLVGVGPRVEESGVGLLAGYAFSAPYEDVTLRGK